MKYREGYKYQLAKDEIFWTKIQTFQLIETRFIQLSPAGELTVRNGYAYDGPSGPTMDTRDAMRGAAFHDAVYQLIRMSLLDPSWRIVADEELGRFMEEDAKVIIESENTTWWEKTMLKTLGPARRALWVRELKKFGAAAADPKNRKPILTAP